MLCVSTHAHTHTHTYEDAEHSLTVLAESSQYFPHAAGRRMLKSLAEKGEEKLTDGAA